MGFGIDFGGSTVLNGSVEFGYELNPNDPKPQYRGLYILRGGLLG